MAYQADTTAVLASAELEEFRIQFGDAAPAGTPVPTTGQIWPRGVKSSD